MGHEVLDATDGRRQRRDRNQAAVVESFIELITSGVTHPTREQLAERSGVSKRSTYRYFPDDSGLVAAVADRVVATFTPVAKIGQLGVGSLDERIDVFVTNRLDAYARTSPITRIARTGYADEPAVIDAFDRIRSMTRRQLREHFEAELSGVSADEREGVITLLAVPFLSDSLSYAHQAHDGRTDDVAALLRHHLRTQLAAIAPTLVAAR